MTATLLGSTESIMKLSHGYSVRHTYHDLHEPAFLLRLRHIKHITSLKKVPDC